MSRSGRRELRTRLVLAPLLLGAIAAIYVVDLEFTGRHRGVLTAVVLGLVGFAGILEYVAMLQKARFAVATRLLPLACIALFAAPFGFGWQDIDRELYPVVLITFLLAFPIALDSLSKGKMAQGLEMQGASMLGFVTLAWPMYFAQGIALRHLPSVLFVVLVCKCGDIGAYLIGSWLGRRPLIPHVSSGKTVEGALGSMVASVLVAVVLRPLLLWPEVPLTLTGAILVGIILNVTTQTGDLIESLLKRRCGVKDSSTLLPAHGGVLDLTDSLLYSFPAFFLVLVWIT